MNVPQPTWVTVFIDPEPPPWQHFIDLESIRQRIAHDTQQLIPPLDVITLRDEACLRRFYIIVTADEAAQVIQLLSHSSSTTISDAYQKFLTRADAPQAEIPMVLITSDGYRPQAAAVVLDSEGPHITPLDRPYQGIIIYLSAEESGHQVGLLINELLLSDTPRSTGAPRIPVDITMPVDTIEGDHEMPTIFGSIDQLGLDTERG